MIRQKAEECERIQGVLAEIEKQWAKKNEQLHRLKLELQLIADEKSKKETELNAAKLALWSAMSARDLKAPQPPEPLPEPQQQQQQQIQRQIQRQNQQLLQQQQMQQLMKQQQVQLSPGGTSLVAMNAEAAAAAHILTQQAERGNAAAAAASAAATSSSADTSVEEMPMNEDEAPPSLSPGFVSLDFLFFSIYHPRHHLIFSILSRNEMVSTIIIGPSYSFKSSSFFPLLCYLSFSFLLITFLSFFCMYLTVH